MSGSRLENIGPAAEGERGMSVAEIAEAEQRGHEPVPPDVPVLIHRWKRMGYKKAEEVVVPGSVMDALIDWYDAHEHTAKAGAQ